MDNLEISLEKIKLDEEYNEVVKQFNIWKIRLNKITVTRNALHNNPGIYMAAKKIAEEFIKRNEEHCDCKAAGERWNFDCKHAFEVNGENLVCMKPKK